MKGDLGLLTIAYLIKGLCEDKNIEAIEEVMDKIIAEATRGRKTNTRNAGRVPSCPADIPRKTRER